MATQPLCLVNKWKHARLLAKTPVLMYNVHCTCHISHSHKGASSSSSDDDDTIIIIADTVKIVTVIIIAATILIVTVTRWPDLHTSPTCEGATQPRRETTSLRFGSNAGFYPQINIKSQTQVQPRTPISYNKRLQHPLLKSAQHHSVTTVSLNRNFIITGTCATIIIKPTSCCFKDMSRMRYIDKVLACRFGLKVSNKGGGGEGRSLAQVKQISFGNSWNKNHLRMDVAPWCYKWTGLGISERGEV